jgi:hypothetical protein
MQFALLLLSVAGYIGVPIVLVVGWRRWLRRSSPQGRLSVLSLTGFALGSSSALLAASSALYAMVVRGFRYYDPTLLVIYKVGILLSLGGLGFAIGGVWSRGALRWHAPILSIGMLLLWLIWTSAE